MPTLESLLNDIANYEAKHDFENLVKIRNRVVDEFPDTIEAAEAQYKVGLDFLFRARDLNSAVQHFAEAAARKVEFLSDAARTSLGLCYFHQGKTQAAMFELRKIAHSRKITSHSVTALAFMENIFESEGNLEELDRIRKERSAQLEVLITEAIENGDMKSKGFYLFELGLLQADLGDLSASVLTLERAKGLGPDAIGADLFRSVVDALSDLSVD